MLLNNDFDGFKNLYDSVNSYYKKTGNRHVSIFSDKPPSGDEPYYVRFLVDRKYVVQYAILRDRGVSLSSLTMAIGPHFFAPADFWSFDNGARFKMDASTDAVAHNLALFDEFIGYSDALKKAYGYKE